MWPFSISVITNKTYLPKQIRCFGYQLKKRKNVQCRSVTESISVIVSLLAKFVVGQSIHVKESTFNKIIDVEKTLDYIFFPL